ncbi:hypothetical protein AJ80_08814 [Polytolypa hystricis UAMH7299]|uniref:Leucine rich repeat protein n=1 Tax=Polytolypa hystricis (strain UAMH7299) TaxID=1447883 RepID=A0A2B7X1S9_POLH7|nr:hypothetical protein AJ80_08814 [Polytolypa hystricis UAMH7299]
MAKLNYTGRKIQGVRMAQAVSKDLRKRIPPGTGTRASARDPHVEIDLTGRQLTDEGFDIIANELIDLIQYRDAEHPNGIIRLTEVSLSGNDLSVASMVKLGRIIALSVDSMTQLDLSNNLISVIDAEHRAIWSVFLESFQGCYMLKKIDFSGNKLGVAGFDVLARVYAQSDLYFLEAAANGESNGDSKNGNTQNGHNGSTTLEKSPAGAGAEARKRSSTAHEQFHELNKASGSDYASSRGLRSVPYLVFSSCCTTNADAFHMWNMILSHHHPDELFKSLPPGKSATPMDETAKNNGIVYMPNDQLPPLGKQLLDLGYGLRILTSDDAETSSTESEDENDEEDLVSDIIKKREIRRKHQVEMERVKNRVLLDIFKKSGFRSGEIWSVAFDMMVTARALLLNDTDRLMAMGPVEEGPRGRSYSIQEEPEEEASLSSLAPEKETSVVEWPTLESALEALKLGGSPTKGNNGANAAKFRGRFPRNASPSMSLQNFSRLRAGSTSSQTGRSRSMIPRTNRFGLPLALWRRIIADATGAGEILDTQQQMQVLRYAADWGSVKQELRLRGALEYEQIWKILSSMGCLSYTGM